MTAPVGGPTAGQLLQPGDVPAALQCYPIAVAAAESVMCPVGSSTSMSAVPVDFISTETGNRYENLTYSYLGYWHLGYWHRRMKGMATLPKIINYKRETYMR